MATPNEEDVSMNATLHRLRCPECNAVLRVPTSAIGKNGTCPKCKCTFPLPDFPPETTPSKSPAKTPTPATQTSVVELGTSVLDGRRTESAKNRHVSILLGSLAICVCFLIGGFLFFRNSPTADSPSKELSLGQRYSNYERDWRIEHGQPEFADEQRLGEIRDAVDASDVTTVTDLIRAGTLDEWREADDNQKIAAAFVMSKTLRDQKQGDILHEAIVSCLAVIDSMGNSSMPVAEAVGNYAEEKFKLDAIEASKETFSGFESASVSQGDVMLGQFREAMSPWYKINHKLRPNEWNYGNAIDRRETHAGYAVDCKDNIIGYLILSLNHDHRHGDNDAILSHAVQTLAPKLAPWLKETLRSDYETEVQTFESEGLGAAVYWNDNTGDAPPGIELEISLDGRPFKFVPANREGLLGASRQTLFDSPPVKLPTDLQYTYEVSKHLNEKQIADVRINQRITEDQLKTLSNRIYHDLDGRTVPRFHLHYRLTGNLAPARWAFAHNNYQEEPRFGIEGVTLEQERELRSIVPELGHQALGQWLVDFNPSGFVWILYRKDDGSLRLYWHGRDGSKFDEDAVEGTPQRFRRPAAPGEWFEVKSNGEILLSDDDGIICHGLRIESQ